MSKFMARYPTAEEQLQLCKQFTFHEIVGSLKECKFYTSNPKLDKSGLAFRAAFDAAKRSSNDKDLCACAGSMLCAVSDDLIISVMEALRGLGIKPCIVELPSQARLHGINETNTTQMDWPSILVYFAFICILVLKNTNQKFMSSCIQELGKRVGLKSWNDELNVPFDCSKANAIRTMLGDSLTLRETLMKFIIGNMNQPHASMHSVCQYLYYILSWSGMDELVLMNEMLVIPGSSILLNPWYSGEAENLLEACAAIQSHTYPQFFMILASDMQRTKFDVSRFPMLLKIARRKKIVAMFIACFQVFGK